MSPLEIPFERELLLLVAVALVFSLTMILVVVVERAAVAGHAARLRQLNARYTPLIQLALAGDERARSTLMNAPSRHRLTIARLVLMPLLEDRDPARIAKARALAGALSFLPFADRLLRSPWWWRRAIALRGLGVMQAVGHTAAVVAALDDPNDDVRNTALDALADLQDPAALPAIVVRMHDATLHRARRGAALAAFGSRSEPFLLEMAAIDDEHRLNYARALAICGTAASRPLLCEWTRDHRAAVRAAALQTLARIGIDPQSKAIAVGALEDADASVRAAAAAALHGSTDRDTASTLARHLDDTWAVALQAARALQTMNATGRIELEAHAAREDLTGVLARQMLWEAKGPR